MDRKGFVKILAIIAFAALVFGIVSNFSVVLSLLGKGISLIYPILLGFAVAFVLNIPLRRIEKWFFPNCKKPLLKKMSRPISVTLAVLLVIALIALIIYIVLPEVIAAVGIFGQSLPPFVEKVQAWILENANRLPWITEKIQDMNIDWNKVGDSMFQALQTGAMGLVGSTVTIISSTVSGVVNTVIAVIFAMYVLINKERLCDQLKRIMTAYLPEKGKNRILYFSNVASQIFHNFITGQCTEACILGILCFIGMSAFRLPYAPMVSALVGVTALIPIVGAFIGVGVGAFMILMISPMKALIFLIFILILQQIEGNVIYPKVVGASVGLPAMWVLAAVTIGAGIGGIMGMLFSVPVASILYVLIKEHVNKKTKVLAAKQGGQEG